jgi:UDP-N-acetyl-D-glucosamine dehydrogenase
MIEASMMVNDQMPEYTVNRCGKMLNNVKKALNGSKVLILGVAYKQDVDDYRESPALKVIEIFKKNGSEVTYYDPYIQRYRYKGQEYDCLRELTAEALQEADLVVVTTAHTKVDYAFVQRHSKMIFDTKNAMKNVESRDNIELL